MTTATQKTPYERALNPGWKPSPLDADWFGADRVVAAADIGAARKALDGICSGRVNDAVWRGYPAGTVAISWANIWIPKCRPPGNALYHMNSCIQGEALLCLGFVHGVDGLRWAGADEPNRRGTADFAAICALGRKRARKMKHGNRNAQSG